MLLKMKVDAFGDGASAPSQIHHHAKRKNPFRNDSDFFLVLFLILFS